MSSSSARASRERRVRLGVRVRFSLEWVLAAVLRALEGPKAATLEEEAAAVGVCGLTVLRVFVAEERRAYESVGRDGMTSTWASRTNSGSDMESSSSVRGGALGVESSEDAYELESDMRLRWVSRLLWSYALAY